MSSSGTCRCERPWSPGCRQAGRALRGLLLLVAAAAPFGLGAGAPRAVPPPILPRPAAWHAAPGDLTVPAEVTLAGTGAADPRVAAAVERLLGQWTALTGRPFRARAGASATALLVIDCARAAPAVPRLGDDEAYTLSVTPGQAVLRAATTTGALRGLATLTQLLMEADGRSLLPAGEVRDAPRFPWRGLMIDVVRHWQPLPVLRRQLDGMALVKLNVLHLHLTDDQGFRIESRTHPELHTLAADGHYFTQAEMRGLLDYAHARGIRVVPEFDLPGHATSWLRAHPELGGAPGPYAAQRRWGVHAAVLDPTQEALHGLLEDFLGEMAALFPDEYLHVGGDENNGVHWGANERIQAFIRTHGLRDQAGLQAWFNGRLAALLSRHGKRLMGWDEILHPDLPADSVVHSWRGARGVEEAARAGHPVVLSHGYYIDLNHPAAEHYAVDPLPADTPLTPAEQARVLGGEATMWTEWVTPAFIDTRLWPRTAAIAERLWSPGTVTDAADLYRRLDRLEPRLRAAGLLAEGWPRPDLPGLDPAGAAALRILAAVVEPVKGYRRGALQPESDQDTPLNELADWALPESRPAREFAAALDAWLGTSRPRARDAAAPLIAQFQAWATAGDRAAAVPADGSPRAQGRVRTARALAALGRTGAEALAALSEGRALPAEVRAAADRAEGAAAPNAAAVEFPFLPAWRRLLAATADPAESAAAAPPGRP